jgi:exopolysaccharide biosynthesis WecB/TagA/CpsF family protein
LTSELPILPVQPLFGVDVCACSISEARDTLLSLAANGQAATVEFLAVNNLTIANDDERFGTVMGSFDYVFPDGAPVVWAINRSEAAQHAERITAREMTLELCAGAADAQIPVFFYGSTDDVVHTLAANIRDRYPGLVVAGHEASVFRPLTEDEDQALIHRIRESGARIVFVGLGCPLQEQFVSEHRQSIEAVQLCVGSAFKFLAGHHSIPPVWVQRMGLEWLVRVFQEPRRLWHRYLRTNSRFLWMLLRRSLGLDRR